MPDGPSDTPEMPDLQKPPDIKEGVGGGPAGPVGAAISTEEKEAWDETSDTANYAAGVMATAGAAMLATGPEAGPASILAGVASGLFWIASQVFSDLAEDPPQPHDRIVTITPRLCPVPETPDPILRSFGIVSQQGVFTLVTARCYLDALERLAGAQQANHLSWAITHNGVALQCRRALVVNLANCAAAIYAASRLLKGSAHDLALKTETGNVGAWINSPGVEPAMAQRLKGSGLTEVEVQNAINWWKTNPTYTGSPSTLSAELKHSAERLYITAVRLHAIWHKHQV